MTLEPTCSNRDPYCLCYCGEVNLRSYYSQIRKLALLESAMVPLLVQGNRPKFGQPCNHALNWSSGKLESAAELPERSAYGTMQRRRIGGGAMGQSPLAKFFLPLRHFLTPSKNSFAPDADAALGRSRGLVTRWNRVCSLPVHGPHE